MTEKRKRKKKAAAKPTKSFDKLVAEASAVETAKVKNEIMNSVVSVVDNFVKNLESQIAKELSFIHFQLEAIKQVSNIDENQLKVKIRELEDKAVGVSLVKGVSAEKNDLVRVNFQSVREDGSLTEPEEVRFMSLGSGAAFGNPEIDKLLIGKKVGETVDLDNGNGQKAKLTLISISRPKKKKVEVKTNENTATK